MTVSILNRREFLKVFAAMGGTALLAACAPAAAPTTAPKQEPTKAPEATAVPAATSAPAAAGATKLQIMWRTNADEQPMIDESIKDFSSKNASVALEQVVVPWAEYEPKLMTMYAGGLPPDIYGTGGTNPYVERSYRGMTMVLDPYVEKEGADFKNDLWPVGLNSYTKNGKLVAMTFALLGAGVFYNATLFEKAGVKGPPTDWKNPWTWEDMLDAAKKLTLSTKNDGNIDQYGLNVGHWSPWYFTRMWGQDLISREDYSSGLEHKWQTDQKAVYEACVAGLQARADCILKDKVTPTPATSQSLGQIGPLLKTGAVAMEMSGGWVLWGDLPEQFKYRCGTNPKGGVGGSGTTAKNCWCEPLQICSKTKFGDQAWAFVKYMTSDPAAITIQLSHRNLLPASRKQTDLYVKTYGKKVDMTEQEFRDFFVGGLEQADTTVPDHILVGSAAVRDIETAECDPIWLGTKTAKEAVDSMIPKINAKLEENLKQLNIQ